MFIINLDVTEWTQLLPKILWQQLVQEVKEYYDYNIEEW